jgi:hypothetical protein
LQGHFVIEIEGGSTAPKNLPQLIQQAQGMQQMFGNDPDIDQRQLKRRMLELSGVLHPDAFLVQQDPPLNPDVLQRLEAMGVNPDVIQIAVEASQRENPPAGEGDQQQNQPPDQQQAA